MSVIGAVREGQLGVMVATLDLCVQMGRAYWAPLFCGGLLLSTLLQAVAGNPYLGGLLAVSFPCWVAAGGVFLRALQTGESILATARQLVSVDSVMLLLLAGVYQLGMASVSVLVLRAGSGWVLPLGGGGLLLLWWLLLLPWLGANLLMPYLVLCERHNLPDAWMTSLQRLKPAWPACLALCALSALAFWLSQQVYLQVVVLPLLLLWPAALFQQLGGRLHG